MIRERDERHLRMLSSLTDVATEVAARKLVGGEVSLTWAIPLESAPAGGAMIRTCANLVVRFCPNLRILPVTPFAAEVAALLKAIDPNAQPATSPSENAVRVVLGGGTATGDVTASAQEWTAYVSGHGVELPAFRSRDRSNVFGALTAAALAAAEVFKRLLPPKPERGELVERAAYSAFTYGTPASDEPKLGTIRIELPALLVGMGAVGQAFLDALLASDASGSLTIIDKGCIDSITDLNRCVLADVSDFLEKRAKVGLAVRHAASSDLEINAQSVDLFDFAAKIDSGEALWPKIALSALDDNEPRHRLQRLWPDLLLEGATGDTLAQIFRFHIDSGLACLRCIHPMQTNGNYGERLAQMSGLSAGRISAAMRGTEDRLSDMDVAQAPQGVRGLLAKHVGGDLCGVLGELERYAASRENVPVEPSVSFTSYLAGVFLAAEFVKAVTGLHTILPGRYQIDPIANLFPDPPWPEPRNSSCSCVTRRAAILAYRKAMRRT